MKSTLNLIGLSLLLPLFLAGQKSVALEKIEQINRSYKQLRQLRSELDYVMYATHTGAKAIDKQQAVFSRSGDAYLYHLGPVETLTTTAFSITADHEDKELVLDLPHNRQAAKPFGVDLSAVLDACDSVLVSYPAPGICMLRLDVAMPDVERVELRFDVMSSMMRKVTLFYREASEWEEGKTETKARMEIIYRRQDIRPLFPKDLFSVDRFVQKTHGSFAPAAAFMGYELYDNTRFPND